MTHIPILRHGQPYESIDKIEIVHHATGEAVACVSQANAGLIVRDIGRMRHDILDSFSMKELLAISKKAGAHFMAERLPLGDSSQSFDDYVRELSATTGMPITLCRNNAAKIHRVFDEMDAIVAGLTRGFDLSILDRGFGDDDGRTLSWFREARVFGAVLPSNSPGVHSLWMPAIAMKTPVAVKPGREEPWTPWRIIQSYIAAGIPREAFGFYPADHGGAAALLNSVDRSMIFGDSSTTRPYRNNPAVELHGPGYSKIILGEDAAGEFERYIDVMVSSILANGGRSCINASAVWTPRNADRIADAIARRLAEVKALPADDPNAQLAAFANPQTAQRMNATIEQSMPGAVDLCQQHRGSPRLVVVQASRLLLKPGRLEARTTRTTSDPAALADKPPVAPGQPTNSGQAAGVHGCAYLLPTIIRCDRDHPLANREFLFPYAAVVECPTAEIPSSIGPTLVATGITDDATFRRALMACPDIDRLNLGPVPTWKLSWDQPHEGNLFEHLYRQRAFQLQTSV